MGERTQIRIPCTTGINQASPIDGGGFDACENFRGDGIGRALVKRTGLVRYAGSVRSGATTTITGDGTTTIVENCSMLANAGGHNMIGTSCGWIHALEEAVNVSNKDLFYYIGRHSTAHPIRRDRSFIGSNLGGGASDYGYGKYPPSVAVSGDGYVCAAAITTELDCKIVIYNPDRAIIWQHILTLGASPRVKVLGHSTGFYIIASAGTAINYYNLALYPYPGYDTIELSSATQVATLNAAGNSWDAAGSGGSGWHLVYQSSATEGTVVTKSGLTPIGDDTFTTGGIDNFSVSWLDMTGVNVWVGWYDTSAVEANYLVYTVSCVQVLASTQITTFTGYNEGGPPLFGIARDELTGASNADTAFYVIRARDTAGTDQGWACMCGTADSSGAVTAATGDDIYNALPISKPDNYSRFWAMLGSPGDTTLMRMALLRLPEPTIQQPVTIELLSERSLAATYSSGPAYDIDWHGQIAAASGFSAYCLPFCIAEYGGLPFYAIDVMTYRGSEDDPHVNTVQCGPVVVTSGQPVEASTCPYPVAVGGALMHTGAAEIGWAMRPTILSATAVSDGSGSLNVGATYSYKALVEYVDIYGRRHLSEPSAAATVTITSGTNAVTCTISTPGCTQRNANPSSFQERPTVLLYRTLNGGTTHHRVPTSVPRLPFDTMVLTVTDTVSDSSVGDEETLYTDGGALPNDAAPSCRFIARVDDRIWCGGLWDPSIIQCSKYIVPQEPINFADNDAFRVQLSGPCTGLAGMGGSLVAFTASSIEIVSGDGPDDRGAGYFSPPEILSSTIGCTSDRSIVTTDAGIIFQNSAGFFLLPRGFGQVQPLGDAIRDYVLAQPYCWGSSSVIGTDQFAVWLMSTDSGTLPAHLLAYDVTHNQWFLDVLDGGTYRELGAWSTGLALCTSSLNSGSVSTPIAVQRFTSTDTTDDGSTFLDAKIGTDTMHPFGVGGQGNVHAVMLVFSGGNFTLHIDVTTDEHAQQQASFTIPANSNTNNYRVVMPEFSRCSTIQIDVYDSENSGADLSFSPTAIVLDVESDDDLRYIDEGERA